MIGQKIEQRSIAKLNWVLFNLSGKSVTASRDQIKVSLLMKVLFGSFVEWKVFLQIGGMKVGV